MKAEGRVKLHRFLVARRYGIRRVDDGRLFGPAIGEDAMTSVKNFDVFAIPA